MQNEIPQNEFPLGLRQSLEAGDCVLFVGAGIGCHLKTPDGGSAPDATALARELADYFGIGTTTYDQLLLRPFVEESHSFLDQFLVQLDIGPMHELPPISRYTRRQSFCVSNQPSPTKRRTWLASRLCRTEFNDQET